MGQSSEFKKGDWVRGPSPGIWQVQRVVPAHYEPRYRLSDSRQLYDGPSMILKRLVSDRWKPAFEVQAAQYSWIRKLNQADRRKLQKYLLENPEQEEAFAKFEKSIHFILNLGFSLPRRSDFPKFKRLFAGMFGDGLEDGLTDKLILEGIQASEFADCFGEIPQDATLQFVCLDYEIRRRQLIYRDINFLKH